MKKFIYKNRFYLTLTVIAAAALLWFVVMLSLGEGKPENIPSVEQADELVSDTLSSLPRSVSAGAKYIFNNIDVEVRDVKAGNDKNVFIDCTYTTPDVLGSLENEIPEIMGQAYEYMQKQQTGGAMVNATKISLYFSERLVSVLEDAPRRQGEITLEAYETQDGLSLYLSDDTVDMLSGGLISVSRMIKDTDEIAPDKTYVAPHSVELLSAALTKVMREVRVTDEEAKQRFKPLVEKKTVSVALIVEKLARRLSGGRKVKLESFFRSAESRSELVSMFLAMLELLKSGMLIMEETDPDADSEGIIDAVSGVTVSLEENADISGMTNLISVD